MTYHKIHKDGYLLGVTRGGVSPDGITEQEYNTILATLQNPPPEEPGYYWALRDDLTWERVKQPDPEPEQPDEFTTAYREGVNLA